MSSNFPMRADQAPLNAILIGTGFAGVGMAVAFREAGVHDFLILEKSHDVGGVRRDNSYPGPACDVPSHLHSFFAPNQQLRRNHILWAERSVGVTSPEASASTVSGAHQKDAPFAASR